MEDVPTRQEWQDFVAIRKVSLRGFERRLLWPESHEQRRGAWGPQDERGDSGGQGFLPCNGGSFDGGSDLAALQIIPLYCLVFLEMRILERLQGCRGASCPTGSKDRGLARLYSMLGILGQMRITGCWIWIQHVPMLDLGRCREHPAQLLCGPGEEAEQRQKDTHSARSPSRAVAELEPGLMPWLLAGWNQAAWARVIGLNGCHLVPGSYLSEAAPET